MYKAPSGLLCRQTPVSCIVSLDLRAQLCGRQDIAVPAAPDRLTVHAAEAVQGNLEISVSRLQNPFTHWPPWPLKNVRIKQFGSPAELETAILASACVVPFPPVHVEGLGNCIE